MERETRKITAMDALKEKAVNWIRISSAKWYATQYLKAIRQNFATKTAATLEINAPSLKEMGEEYGGTD